MAITLAVLATGASCFAGPLDGEWSIVWSRKAGADCAPDGSDAFTLDLWSDGTALCGTHLATAQFGHRVDEGDLLDGRPTITGTTKGAGALVTYRSARDEGIVIASIRRRGKKLYWRVLRSAGPESLLPMRAVLKKMPGPVERASEVCGK
jgi:hypothetical protein